MGTDHERREHDVPVVEDHLAVILEEVAHSQVSVNLNLLVWV